MDEQKKVLTPEEQAIQDALKAKREQKAKERRDALEKVINFAKEYGDDEVKACAAILVLREPREAGAPRSALRDRLLSILGPNKTIHEDRVWTEFKLGRREMHVMCIDALKKAKTADEYLWISFDGKSGQYTLVGEGPDMPEGWKGYLPKSR